MKLILLGLTLLHFATSQRNGDKSVYYEEVNIYRERYAHKHEIANMNFLDYDFDLEKLIIEELEKYNDCPEESVTVQRGDIQIFLNARYSQLSEGETQEAGRTKTARWHTQSKECKNGRGMLHFALDLPKTSVIRGSPGSQCPEGREPGFRGLCVPSSSDRRRPSTPAPVPAPTQQHDVRFPRPENGDQSEVLKEMNRLRAQYAAKHNIANMIKLNHNEELNEILAEEATNYGHCPEKMLVKRESALLFLDVRAWKLDEFYTSGFSKLASLVSKCKDGSFVNHIAFRDSGRATEYGTPGSKCPSGSEQEMIDANPTGLCVINAEKEKALYEKAYEVIERAKQSEKERRSICISKVNHLASEYARKHQIDEVAEFKYDATLEVDLFNQLKHNKRCSEPTVVKLEDDTVYLNIGENEAMISELISGEANIACTVNTCAESGEDVLNVVTRATSAEDSDHFIAPSLEEDEQEEEGEVPEYRSNNARKSIVPYPCPRFGSPGLHQGCIPREDYDKNYRRHELPEWDFEGGIFGGHRRHGNYDWLGRLAQE